jgi:excisionase family DNA binding protein
MASDMTSELLDQQPVLPGDTTTLQAVAAAAELGRFIDRHPDLTEVDVSLPDGAATTVIRVPVSALRLLLELLTHTSHGHPVSVGSLPAELTTQQAADILNVSRPFLVKLLDERRIPHRRVGNRRRVLLADLLAYQRIDNVHRRAVADELTAEAQRLGLGY